MAIERDFRKLTPATQAELRGGDGKGRQDADRSGQTVGVNRRFVGQWVKASTQYGEAVLAGRRRGRRPGQQKALRSRRARQIAVVDWLQYDNRFEFRKSAGRYSRNRESGVSRRKAAQTGELRGTSQPVRQHNGTDDIVVSPFKTPSTIGIREITGHPSGDQAAQPVFLYRARISILA